MRLLLKSLLVALLCMVTNKALAYDEIVEINGIYYELHNQNSPKDATVVHPHNESKDGKYSGDICIPETIKYRDDVFIVKTISFDAFKDCTSLNSIILPKSISYIHKDNFSGCVGLTYVFFSSNTRIEKDAFKECTKLNRNPNDETINVTRTVIDTLKAEKDFEYMKPTLLEPYQKGVSEQQRCKELSEMLGKKVKERSDLFLLNQAYVYYIKENPSERENKNKFRFVGGVNGSGDFDKNVRKGIITEDVSKYLSSYHQFLADSLQEEKEKIDKGWTEWIKDDRLSYKKITVSMPNPFYRGRRYSDSNYLDELDKPQQRKGWDYLYTHKCKTHSDSYPEEIDYLVYDTVPYYRVTYTKENSYYYLKEVYDSQGKLIYVPSLSRESNNSELKDVRRLVYFKDYINNKYNIKSQSKETQKYIQLRLCRENGFEKTAVEAFGAVFASALVDATANELLSPRDAYAVRKEAKENFVTTVYRDETGEKYLKQLEKDHATEFGYVYIIERLTNVSFRVIYLNSQTLKPSYCAVVTYRTGDKPYTTAFSTKLVDIPKDIPPAVRD